MYKSPIEIKIDDIVSDAVERADKYIVRYIQQVGVNVDKDELIKALRFDRGQYEKGRNDRDAEIVRCKDCRYYEAENHNCLDELGYARVWEEDDYCSFAERRQERR